MAEKSFQALHLNKRAINEGLNMDIERAFAYEAELFGIAFSTEDQKAGMEGFLQKKKVQFRKPS
ncbi:short-chain-enoyl-CoA hydratase [Heliorestis convoluta]|uniref:short-chain-enoyl-CoA hydratase n=1 Tax=Heliorestis convoluta TaxID=356322 RepID=A0A5Q2N0Y2_9FIRM|nr:short-chain-enoyl-CoA hydratase [Heliorestis convoluta]